MDRVEISSEWNSKDRRDDRGVKKKKREERMVWPRIEDRFFLRERKNTRRLVVTRERCKRRLQSRMFFDNEREDANRSRVICINATRERVDVAQIGVPPYRYETFHRELSRRIFETIDK